MTNEEKELLLKDLSARLPYGVKVCDNKNVHTLIGMAKDKIYSEEAGTVPCIVVLHIDNTRPYLRPMSSITDEENEELDDISERCSNFDLSEIGLRIADLVSEFCNRHHFDYRGLIKKGLALEATEDMYKQN